MVVGGSVRGACGVHQQMCERNGILSLMLIDVVRQNTSKLQR